jgi:TRAP-type C4-dicarboxylate transport system permease small subunit
MYERYHVVAAVVVVEQRQRAAVEVTMVVGMATAGGHLCTVCYRMATMMMRKKTKAKKAKRAQMLLVVEVGGLGLGLAQAAGMVIVRSVWVC